MKRIIHLSDLHIGYKGLDGRFATILENLKREKGRQAAEYVIVITGDLVENAHTGQYFQNVKMAFASLKAVGFKDILVVPGNHDYGTGNNSNKKFIRIFHDLFYSGPEGFPRKDLIDGVAFIGLDSMAEEVRWYDEIWAEGEIGDKQLVRLRSVLRQDSVRACKKRVIYLHHHPFDYRPLHQLKDSKKLKAVLTHAIKEGISIDAILYGHNHEGKDHNGWWGIPRCYDAGSATMKPRPWFIDWLPWYRSHSSIREIDLENPNTHKDHILHLLRKHTLSLQGTKR